MATKRLTDIGMAYLSLAAGTRHEIWDTIVPGLGIPSAGSAKPLSPVTGLADHATAFRTALTKAVARAPFTGTPGLGQALWMEITSFWCGTI